jgi:hypothetical protein
VSDRDLLAAYRSTVWTIATADEELLVRPGQSAPPPLRPAAIVTAYNPASRRLSPAANRRANAALRDRLAALGLAVLPTLAHGSSSAWDEPGWCLPGGVREIAVSLAADFGQNAIVWIDPQGEVTIVCTRAGFCGAAVGDVLG